MTFTRRFTTVFIAMMLAFSGGFALAQDDASPEAVEVQEGDGTAFASGIGVAATAFDERGNPTFTMAVTAVEMDWQDYDPMFTPEAGKMYVKMTIQITNLTNRPMQVNPYGFTVLDNYGLTAEAGYFWGTSEFTIDPVSIEAGESGVIVTAFSMWSDSRPMLVMFNPEWNAYTVVHLGEE